uniref:Uncharacterized protein TCIL3000_9_6010 n=1 Tax=Trypanosoma congolense (strain IL3000) TaxID=1068625 RepID=G0UUX9_TRYCI|nr:unnamed protein product [Trypanosoma congolense IL3000]
MKLTPFFLVGAIIFALHCPTHAVLLPFPPSFYVTTGTTIPFTSSSPVAQAGSIYVSNESSRMRVDNFFMGFQYSFVVDGKNGRGFVFESNVASSSGGAGGENGASACRVFALRRGFEGPGVPDEFVKHAELSLVRGVKVWHFTGYSRSGAGPLQEVDYFVRNVSTQAVPWRVQMRRQRQAPKELTGSPVTLPNWRYFGGLFFDEVAMPRKPFDDHLERLMQDTTVTVDFYNFVPVEPDPSVFAVPAHCEESSVKFSSSDVDISLAQRFLVDFSLYAPIGQEMLQEKLNSA